MAEAVNNTAANLQASRNSLQSAFHRRAEAASDQLGKDDFLKLLMAQVTHQDPLDPMDSKGMMEQLTNMGSMEQLININESLGELQKTQSDVVRASTFAFLDKDVTVKGGRVPVTNGSAPALQFSLPREAETVSLNIVDAGGEPVRRLELGSYGPGTHTVEWNATDANGEPVPDGTYRYRVNANDADAQPVAADLYVRGKVSGLRFNEGRPLLKINGEEVDIRDVIEMSNRSERLFGDRLPAGLREDIRTRPPVQRHRP